MTRASSLYEYDYATNTIRLKNKKCPRCDRIMAKHETPTPRWACGYCGYTEYIVQKQSK
ncbi:MAG: 30S ribosomal protein S27ae [Candidatus Methanomethylicota archaeon]|uniref:30S ribosomal protein S27ae n=1 Tax=Thermoproteota archaeon TaxID=2056631 RepID=A0A497EUG0_9CREN|nr:MAG: 30S ribosomal protein S27ae [Candidatus Verstraetearchaeota archaeon]RLE53145.1 MAG: 30S ribosomal protein S27ae [Candidatus Verstraetearchaeota archaeon]